MTDYEYYSASQWWPNTNIILLPKNDQILLTNANFVELLKRKASKTSSESYKVMLNLPSPLMTEANYKCKQLPIHMTHPMWLWYMRMNCSFGAQSTFGSTEYSKKNTPHSFFRGLVDSVIRKVTNFHVPTHQKYQCSAKYVYYTEKIPSGIRFEKIIQIQIQMIFGLRKSPE